jgi:ribonuclease J
LFAFSCNDYQLLQLIDIQPKERSEYIRSLTEPFNDEMELKEDRVKMWLAHFGLITREKGWHQVHVSGHGSGDQIKRIIQGVSPKVLIPVHTIHEDYHKKWHNNVKQMNAYDSLDI